MTAPLEFHFAPLQGYTDAAFRKAFSTCFGGVDRFYTPFIRVEREGFRNRDIRELGRPEAGTVPQILPGSRDEFRMLADMLAGKGFRSADINLGCPFPLIAARHRGAGMLPHPDEVEAVLRTVEEYPGTEFSVKLRLGWQEPDECLALADILNSLPFSHITLHARTGRQQYRGVPDLEAFARFQEVCSRPLFYNGDIRTVEDIRSLSARFPGLGGMAVGRGLLADPFLLKEYREGVRLVETEKTGICRTFHGLLLDHYAESLEGEAHLLQKMKGLWEYFLPGSDRRSLKRIRKAVRMDQYLAAVSALFNAAGPR